MSPKGSSPRIERRRSARADASLSMRVERPPTDGELTKIVTESQNISASGVYCTSPHYLAPLSKVALTIILPHHSPRPAAATGAQRLLKCDGIVVRCVPADDGPRNHSYELACSFLALDRRHRDLIEEFVTWRNIESMNRAVRGATPAKSRRKTARAPARKAAGVTPRKAAGATARQTAGTRKAAPARRKTARSARPRTRGSSVR